MLAFLPAWPYLLQVPHDKYHRTLLLISKRDSCKISMTYNDGHVSNPFNSMLIVHTILLLALLN